MVSKHDCRYNWAEKSQLHVSTFFSFRWEPAAVFSWQWISTANHCNKAASCAGLNWLSKSPLAISQQAWGFYLNTIHRQYQLAACTLKKNVSIIQFFSVLSNWNFLVCEFSLAFWFVCFVFFWKCTVNRMLHWWQLSWSIIKLIWLCMKLWCGLSTNRFSSHGLGKRLVFLLQRWCLTISNCA